MTSRGQLWTIPLFAEFFFFWLLFWRCQVGFRVIPMAGNLSGTDGTWWRLVGTLAKMLHYETPVQVALRSPRLPKAIKGGRVDRFFQRENDGKNLEEESVEKPPGSNSKPDSAMSNCYIQAHDGMNGFESYLSSRSFRVKCDNHLSSLYSSSSGVPGALFLVLYFSSCTPLPSALSSLPFLSTTTFMQMTLNSSFPFIHRTLTQTLLTFKMLYSRSLPG